MCFVFTDPDLIIDEPELQSANLNMDKKGDTLSENEASLVLQRHEPRDFKDLTGHTFSTIPLDFKPVLTIPWTERPDQGVSNLAADLTIIEKFTTATQSEQPITTSIPRRLTPGTEIEIVTIIDGTKFIAPSSTSDATTTSQESEITSPKETTTDVPSLSTEKPLLTSSPNKSGEESSWTTSYTTSSSTELRPSSPANPSGAPIRSDTSAIVAGAIMEKQESPTSHGTDLSSKNHHNDCRELVGLTGSVYSTIPSGFKPVLTFASEDPPGKDREDVTVIDKPFDAARCNSDNLKRGVDFKFVNFGEFGNSNCCGTFQRLSICRHNQDNFNIQLDNAPFERTYTEPAQPVQPAPAIWKS
ncbi:hypothetical protein H9L39_10679 [Fusarium oxysporum f. sp. albedinis]|nr:hypothetical protein H9L39_10679 [Fusarium oxysporum f. sp. albedinis]